MNSTTLEKAFVRLFIFISIIISDISVKSFLINKQLCYI